MSDTATIEPPVAAPASPPPPPDKPPVVAAPASPINEVWTKDWIKPDWTLEPKALDRLPDHLKGLRPTLERQKSFEDVLTVMQQQQVLVGKKALAPLPPDAPPLVLAERKALLDTINGVPATPKDYGIAKPADLPDAAWNQPLADGFAAWAQKNSVAPAAVRELLKLNVDTVQGQLKAQADYEAGFWQKEQQTFDGIIKRENIPADRASALVEKGAHRLGLDLNDEATKTFLKGANARLMAMRHALAVGEDSFVQGDARATEQNPKAAADAIVHDKANPLYEQYWNRDGKFPRAVTEAARAKVEELYRLHEAKNPTPRRDRR